MAKKQTTVKKTNGGNGIFKAVVLGPAILIIVVVSLYCGWWGVSKLFYTIHGWTSATVIPWIAANWYVVLIAWALIVLASVVFYYVSSGKKFKPMKDPDDIYFNE